MDMGRRIKELRTGKNMTQEELGELLGVTKATVQKYECGSVENLKRGTIAKMAEIFDVAPSYVMGLDMQDDAPPTRESVEKAIHEVFEYYGIIKKGEPVTQELLDIAIPATKAIAESLRKGNNNK